MRLVLGLDKRKYMKTIRAQLSTHEQALLLINSLTPVGQNWWANDLIRKYGLVKNIPHAFFVPDELDMAALFENGYFEWEELQASMPKVGPWKTS